jgi:acetyl-CoA acyltransferase 2|tara:strand:- start:56 stop:1249 length:1194 start_codon:yes stop_codon:yes gene_type:complete
MSASRVFIVGAKRTPFGAFGGSLKDWTPTQLGAHATRAALADAGVAPELVDTTVFGNVQQTCGDGIYLARHIALDAGIPYEAPSLTVNRLCGSGFQSIINVAQDMMCGDAAIGVAGGAESMSSAPFAVRGTRWGTKLGVDTPMIDTLWEGLTDAREKMPMAMTAEKLAEQYGIDKNAADELAFRSQTLWKRAHEAGVFDAEIAPMELKGRKGATITFAHDEHARPDASLESIAKLKALFKKDGVVSAGNASGISDGAGALVLATEEAVAEHDLTPLARLAGWHYAGVDPTIMGIGPVPAIEGLLSKTGKSLDEIDRIEINEAFAAQLASCEKALQVDRTKLNVNGGAVAMGHPTGASGARITGHLAHQMANDKSIGLAIGSACIGGGQGIALLLERV